ncbi:MAG: ABC transporter permease [Parasporobacterium sp.]|nr:ABC transporter permease [Parasporobacterium sp.]
MKKRKMFYRMVTASLMRRRSRMLIALLAVAIGATILSGLMTIYFDVPRQMGAQFRNYGANMIFTPAQEEFQQADLEQGISLIDPKELVGATPFRYESVRIHEQPLMAAATDMESVGKTSPYWSVDGEWPSVSRQAMVGKTIAENLNLSIGDQMTINYTPEDADEETPDNWIDCKVTAILNTGGSEEEYVYLSMEDMEDLTGVPGVIDLAEISVSATSEKLSSYVETINASVDSVRAELVKRVTASETSVLSKLQALVLLVTIIVLALTMICVATTMTAVVTERRQEIGLRKAIGASDASIMKEFMGESLLLGAIGGILGAIVGFVFAQVVSVNVFGSSISFRPLLAIITIIVSVLITALTCVLPIRSATRVDPALVLKGE